MSDQISRQKLIEAVEKEYHRFIDNDRDVAHNRAIYDVLEIIKAQPPADQWIPCDIARPTESGIYWATVEVYWCDEPVSIQLEYNHKKDEWIGGYDVIAWMPAILPEPYKGD